jgi:hypothetical protein
MTYARIKETVHTSTLKVRSNSQFGNISMSCAYILGLHCRGRE